MMTQAFYTGISGLKTYSEAIDTVSSNLSNNSTIGFRGRSVEFSNSFEEMLAQANSPSSSINSSVGVGVSVSGTAMNQAQGELILAERNTDLAIDGDGWFSIQGEDQTLYTRAGNFNFDANSDLVTDDGYYVLGTMANNIENDILTKVVTEVPLGEMSVQEKLRFPNTLTYPPTPTDEVKFFGNLGVEDIPMKMSGGAIDPQNNRNDISISFTLAAEQPALGTVWEAVAVAQSLDGETIYDTQSGTISFAEDGSFVSTTLTTINNNGEDVALNLGSGYDGLIAVNGVDQSSSSSSNGTPGGDLVGYEINANAEVIATFTNGYQSSVGKIAVFHFQNDQGLAEVSASKYQATSNSGEPLFSTDENGQNILGANVVNYRLESSNINVATGLTELIIFQRAYDANSKSISTANEMMQKALNMDA